VYPAEQAGDGNVIGRRYLMPHPIRHDDVEWFEGHGGQPFIQPRHHKRMRIELVAVHDGAERTSGRSDVQLPVHPDLGTDLDRLAVERRDLTPLT
jgi:hypothetical protein